MRDFDLDPTQLALLCAVLVIAIPATRLSPFLALRGQTSIQARRQRLRMALMLGFSPGLALLLAGLLVPRLWFLELIGLLVVPTCLFGYTILVILAVARGEPTEND
jgi:small neutral amino acid transporter SnatA (MarC family)